jgi:hypothetical protein
MDGRKEEGGRKKEGRKRKEKEFLVRMNAELHENFG